MDILRPALTRIEAMARDFMAQLPNIIIGIVVFFLFYFAARLVRNTMRRVAQKQQKHLSLGLVLGRLAQSAIVFIGLLIALVIALPGFQPAQLIQLLGISGVAIGFAFKDILQNFLAGILLLLTEPSRLGDQIRVGEFEGTVEDIQTRATFIKTYDGRRVVIPNGSLFNQSVIVNTAYDSRRLEYDVGIGYGDDLSRAIPLALQTVREVEGVLSDPAPDVLVYELAGSSVNLRVRWWINPPRRADELESRSHVIAALKQKLYVEEGIDLPYPTQQILFHDQTEQTDGDRSKQREGWPAGKGDVPGSRSIAGALGEISAPSSSPNPPNGAAHDPERAQVLASHQAGERDGQERAQVLAAARGGES